MKIFPHRSGELLAGPLWIEILIPQPKHAIRGSRALCGDPEGSSVTQMQQAGR